MIKSFFIVFIILNIFVIHVSLLASENPLRMFREKAIAFFKPLNLKIEKLEDDLVVIKNDKDDVVKKGMRMDILREGQIFYHPVTKEPLGHIEKRIGKIEIKEVKKDEVFGVVLYGEPIAGDRVRITGAKIKSLFYQSHKVNWYLGDAYNRELKDSNRFELFDTHVKSDNMQLIFDEARKIDAEVIFYIDTEFINSATFLKQKLFWVKDKKELYSDSIEVTADFIKELESGFEILNINGG